MRCKSTEEWTRCYRNCKEGSEKAPEKSRQVTRLSERVFQTNKMETGISEGKLCVKEWGMEIYCKFGDHR